MSYKINDGRSSIVTKAYRNNYDDIFKKIITITYRYKDEIEETEKEFTSLDEARQFYDTTNDEMLAFAIMVDADGNVLEDKLF